ncbi:DUF420 domain-containing protein [Haloparvum alkalitolerans]|uniref:DUF420 domain-containing protein n=1 Tax=Haloparvum alkalitolerans TaxID=1042953 RepID=UPI003CF59ACC
MEFRAREHVPLLTAVCSTVALALVFGAATQSIPTTYVPHPGDAVLAAIPHLNAAFSLTAIGTIALGWRAIRRGNVARHRALMGTSLLLFAAFLTGYLWRLTLVGTTTFPGPEVYYRYVYLPVLAVHMLLAIVCIPLLFYALLLAATRPVAEVYETRHRTVGRVAAPLWLISFAMGVGVYAMLHHVF